MYKLFVNIDSTWLPTRGTPEKAKVLSWANAARRKVEAARRGLIMVTEYDEPVGYWTWGRKRWTEHRPETDA